MTSGAILNVILGSLRHHDLRRLLGLWEQLKKGAILLGDRAYGEYTTLAGFILHIRQHIPKPNEIIMMSPYYFKILTTSETTIDQVQVKILG